MGTKQAEEVRTKLDKPIEQTGKGKSGSNCFGEVKKVHYRNVFETVKMLYKQDGAIAFTRGIHARMLLHIPSTALSWGTYEIVKGLLTQE